MFLIENCTRILLVADPQILGETFDTNVYKSLAIYDSDQYLAQSYRQASGHTRPHAIAYLGDLLDEGSVATDDEYERYSKRFQRIFEPPNRNTKVHNWSFNICWFREIDTLNYINNNYRFLNKDFQFDFKTDDQNIICF